MVNQLAFIYGLYCTCHPNDGVRYVGQTAYTIEKRLYLHKQSTRSGGKRYAVNLWIIKHGEANIQTRLLEVVEDIESLDGAEMDWIANMRSTGRRMLNMTDGGSATRGIARSEETRRRMSEARKGKRTGAQNHNFGKPMSEETKAKMRASKAGYKWSEESRATRHIVKGEELGTSKLKESDVRQIRQDFANGCTASELCDRFQIAKTTIYNILARRSWRHVD